MMKRILFPAMMLCFAVTAYSQVFQIKPQGKLAIPQDLMVIGKAGMNPLLLYSKGTFWREAFWINELHLTTDQQKKMDEIFRQYRFKLIDTNAALQKDELMLAPLVEALPGGDEAKINAQIDKIAEDRAELEKANSKMLVGIFQVLTPDQWTRLRETRRKQP
jgi:Spy/CpxP family protein refolding chaperone